MSVFLTEEGRWRITIRSFGSRIDRLLPRGTTGPQAQELHGRLKAEMYVIQHMPKDGTWIAYVDEAFKTPGSWATIAHNRARRRDKGCALTFDEFRLICLRSNGRCEVTGLPFHDNQVPGSKIRPFFQSIDRIDASKGYSLENCRLICAAVNISLSTWGDAVFEQIAIGYAMNKYVAPNIMQPRIAPRPRNLRVVGKE